MIITVYFSMVSIIFIYNFLPPPPNIFPQKDARGVRLALLRVLVSGHADTQEIPVLCSSLYNCHHSSFHSHG